MPRLHAPEFEDQRWFPKFIRDIATTQLQHVVEHLGLYDAGLSQVRRLLQVANETRVLDMGSGGGGPWPRFVGQLNAVGAPVQVTLTDRFPNAQARARFAGHPNITYLERPVDATQLPADIPGVVTMFTSFHHLKDEQALAVLQSAVDQRRAIGVFEFTIRTPGQIAVSILGGLLGPLLSGVFIRPFRWRNIVFIYLIPIIPLVNMWDSFASSLRTRDQAELRALVAKLQRADDYTWAIDIHQEGRAIPMLYLLGWPPEVAAGERR